MEFQIGQRWMFQTNRDKVLFEVLENFKYGSRLMVLQVFFGLSYKPFELYYTNAFTASKQDAWTYLEGQDRPT